MTIDKPVQWNSWHILSVVIVALVLGGIIGALIVSYQLYDGSPVSTTPDTRDAVPTVSLERIQNGAIVGTTQGDVRLMIGGTPVEADESGAFIHEDAGFLINHIEVVVPPGMNFVASKNGKKYYPVDSAGGQRIVPENRVYFATAREAEAAGFQR